MKFAQLEKAIVRYASDLGYKNGEIRLLNKLNSYKRGLIVYFDLRPSERKKLNDMEIGEPDEFAEEIEKSRKRGYL